MTAELSERIDLRLRCEDAAHDLDKAIKRHGRGGFAQITADGAFVGANISDTRFVYGCRLDPDTAKHVTDRLNKSKRLVESEIVRLCGTK